MGDMHKCSRCQKLFERDEVIIYTRTNGIPYFNCHTCNGKRAKAYRKTEAGKASVKKSITKYEKRNLLKRRAWEAAAKLPKKPCEVCGKDKHIHKHHDDYKKPLEVVYLCVVHHKARHRLLKALQYAQR